jgi:hypothetical protein
MKKIIIFALVLALAVPTVALAATEFSLGGYIKLDTFWDSTQTYKGDDIIARNNDPNLNHGRLKFTAQESRFNFTIKGPKLWGATTTGFIEIDFDRTETGLVYPGTGATGGTGIAKSASGSYTPGLRHAMFRLNWPETELLFGQYWSMLCEWWPEVAESGPFQVTGIPTARLAQIRVTQKFAGAWTASLLVGEPNSVASNRVFGSDTATRGDRVGAEDGEMPQVQAKIQYQQDLWGKAAYYGKPTPFTAQIVGGFQRNIFSPTTPAGTVTVHQFGEDNFGANLTGISHDTYVYPWIVMGTAFIPVIPTHSANLAGTASLMTQWYIGQGVEAFGFAGVGSNLYKWNSGNDSWDPELYKRFGGYVQGQYYFTNQWFLTAAYAMSRGFGVSPGETSATSPGNGGRIYGLTGSDLFSYQHQVDLCLWYRPIQALKFGLEYFYKRTNYLQNTTAANTPAISKFGDDHRVEFVGYFFF